MEENIRSDEKRKLAQWEEKRPLSPSPNQSSVEANNKIVGQSSRVLRQQDFELIKTLGTGRMRRCLDAAVADMRRHLCASMARIPLESQGRRAEQGLCAEDTAQSRWYVAAR
jgi:hypothetical protein